MMLRVIPTEIYSRITGYFRPVSEWNDGKRSEFKDRFKRSSKDLVKKLKEGEKDGRN